VALVELKARFDEEAKHHVRAGARKRRASTSRTASSASRPTRRSPSSCGARRAGSAATRTSVPANYNPTTAKLYEDIGSSRPIPELGADLTDLFNLLTGYSRQREYRRLLVRRMTCGPSSSR